MQEAIFKNLHTKFFHLYNILEKAKSRDRKTNQWLPGVGCKRQALLQEGKGKIWGKSYGTALCFDCGESMTVCLS